MPTLDDYRNPQFVKYCEAALENFISETGVKNALLATPDGFHLASAGGNSAHSADNLAATGSTLFALSSSVITEFNHGATRSVTIDAEKGKVFLCSVDGGQGKVLILLIEANQQTMLAHILHGSRKLSDSIGKRLSLIG